MKKLIISVKRRRYDMTVILLMREGKNEKYY